MALLAALATVTGGVVGLAQALTPGDLQGTPRLGQPLRLDFPLSLEPGESTEGLQVSVRARPSLAAATDEAWLRSPFRILLTDRDGRPTLRICNEQLLQEPMLELHLALRSAAGVITRRRYDVLVDPPLAGVGAVACEPLGATSAVPRANAARAAASGRSARSASGLGDNGQDALVLPGDTLGELAQTLRGDRPIALPYMMEALYQANPEAFVGSPDRLLVGSHLRVPDLEKPAQGGVPALPPPVTASLSEALGQSPRATTPPSTTGPVTVPAPRAGSLKLSYRLFTLPTEAEQGRVARRYLADAESASGSQTPSRVAVTWSTPKASPLAWSVVVIVLTLLGALVWMLRGAFARRPRETPAAAAAAIAPAPPKSAADAIPADLGATRSGITRAPEAYEEVGRDFYEEVATLLSAELLKNPERRDLRFRLLDLYFTAGKRDAFVEHTHDYLRSLRGTPDENWPEIARMGRQIAPETGLYPGTADDDAQHANVIPLQAARTVARRFYEDIDAAALRKLRENLDRSYAELRRDSMFWRELATLAEDWVTPYPDLVQAERLTQYLGGARILFRDERHRPADECAALVAVGQVLMARRLGYSRVVAGGMRSSHALVVAQAAQRLGIDCSLHLGAAERSHHAGALERVMGAQLMLKAVEDTAGGLATTTQRQALRDALNSPESMYVSPAAAGPPPYPTIVTDLAALLGRNLRVQMFESLGKGADVLITHSGDGLHTIGLMQTFLDTADTQLMCMDSESPTAGGMLFPREHRLLRTTGRVRYHRVSAETARFITQFCAEQQYAQMDQAGSEVFAAVMRVARVLPAAQAVVAVLPAEGRQETAKASEKIERVGERLRGFPPPRA